jgi:hypothetical protein
MSAPVQKNYRVGKNARVRLGDNAVVFKAYKGTIKCKRQTFDTTDFEDNGYGSWTRGIIDADVNILCWYPVGDNPWAFWAFDTQIPANIDTVGPVFVYLCSPDPTVLSGPFFKFSGLAIEEIDIDIGVRDVIPFNLTGKSSGSYLLPTS